MVTRPRAACEAFEARLASPDRPESLAGFADPHAATCPDCGPLLADLAAIEAFLGSLAIPAPGSELAGRLHRVRESSAERLVAEEVLGLLTPGSLRLPEPSSALRDRLAAIPATRPAPLRLSGPVADDRPAPAALDRATNPGKRRGVVRTFFADWRLAVVFAYAATLLLVTILGLDPLTAARSTASGLTAAGERAIAEARSTAQARLEGLVEGSSQQPMTSRLSYRVYRTVAVGKARATAFAEMVWDSVFGTVSVAGDEASPPARPGSVPARNREPQGAGLRS